MTKNRKLSGFRFVCALAAAELELRKQEGLNQGYKMLDNQIQLRSLANLGFINIQAIQTYGQVMDAALCFVMRYPHAHRLLAMSRQPLGCSDSEAKRKLYIYNKQAARYKAEREEDDDFESEEETEKWLEEQRAKAADEERVNRLKQAREAQREAQREADKVANWAQERGYQDPWDVLLKLSEGTLVIRERKPCDKE
jgi:transcription antitermination factor NusG